MAETTAKDVLDRLENTVLAVEELNRGIPAIRKSLDEIRSLHDEVRVKREEVKRFHSETLKTEKNTIEKGESYLKKLEETISKVEKLEDNLENTLDGMPELNDIFDITMELSNGFEEFKQEYNNKLIEIEENYKEKLRELEGRIGAGNYKAEPEEGGSREPGINPEEPGGEYDPDKLYTIEELLEFDDVGRLLVRKQKWQGYFCVLIYKIDGKTAYGKGYRYGKPVGEYSYSIKDPSFQYYSYGKYREMILNNLE